MSPNIEILGFIAEALLMLWVLLIGASDQRWIAGVVVTAPAYGWTVILRTADWPPVPVNVALVFPFATPVTV